MLRHPLPRPATMIKAKIRTLPAHSRWPELLQEISDGLLSAFKKNGNTDEQAEINTLTAVEVMIFMMGGQMIYFPMGLLENIDARNKRIAEEFTGANHSDLARRYGLSKQHIYRITKNLMRQNVKTVRAEGGGS
jgi:Mor family transcriptional regulator